MADASLFEFIKSFGSIVGLITGGFVLFDRMIRNRPFLSLRPRSATQSAVDCLFHNVADEGLIIHAVSVEPAVLGIAYSDTLRDVIEAAATPHFESDRQAYIEAKSTATLPLITFSEWDNAKDDTIVKIKIYWRSSGSRWLVTWPISLVRTVGEIRRLEKSAKPEKLASDR